MLTTLRSAKYLLTKLRLKMIRETMLTQFASTNPLAPICRTLRKRYALPAKATEKPPIQMLCLRSSLVEAVADTKASLTPFTASNGM
jgi:hypothetical protein